MKIFKTFITILIVLFSNICLQSQSVFEIEIDNIFIDKQGIAFVNKDEENSFLCNLTPIMKRDFEYDLVLDCDEEDFGTRNESSKSIEFSELKEFELPEQLIEHIRNTKFVKMSNQTETKYIEFLQIFDDNLITQLSYWNSKNGYQYRDFSSVQFKDYTFIRINKKYIIIAIMYEEDPEPRGYIIPKKDGFIVELGSDIYIEDGHKIDSIDIKRHLRLKDFFRLKNTPNGVLIVDKLYNEILVNKFFDKVYLKNNFFQCFKNGKMELYDKSGTRLNIKHLQAAHDSLGSIQCIINNEIKWMDYNWKIHDTFPRPKWVLCGTIWSTQRRIENNENLFTEFYSSGNFFLEVSEIDTVPITLDKSVTKITYLNNQTVDEFDEYSHLLSVFSYPYSYYVLTKGNEKQLVSIRNIKKEKEKRLIYQRELGLQNEIYIYKDSLNAIIESLKDEIEITVHFQGDFEAFGYNHPIKFKSNGLYGYFPQNKEAKYKRLEKFNFFFAEFEDKNGQLGWIDIYGNEYFRQNFFSELKN